MNAHVHVCSWVEERYLYWGCRVKISVGPPGTSREVKVIFEDGTMSLRLLQASTWPHKHLMCPSSVGSEGPHVSQPSLQGGGTSAQESSFLQLPLLDTSHCRSSNSDAQRTKSLAPGQCSLPDGYNQAHPVVASYLLLGFQLGAPAVSCFEKGCSVLKLKTH